MTFPDGDMDTLQPHLQVEGLLPMKNIYILVNRVDVSNDAGDACTLYKTGV